MVSGMEYLHREIAIPGKEKGEIPGKEIFSNFEYLRNVSEPEERREAVERFYEALVDFYGDKIVPLSDVWGKISAQGNLIRRESLEKVLHAVLEDEDIDITPYNEGAANVADDSDYGLRVAMTEGHGGSSGVISVMGFSQDSLDVDHVERPSSDRREPERYGHIRTASGVLQSRDVRYIIFRIPAQFFPEEHFTEDEEDRFEEGRQPHVSRVILLEESGGGALPH